MNPSLSWQRVVGGKRDGRSWISEDAAQAAHHAVDQQAIRRHAKEQGIDAEPLLWDPRVGIPLTTAEHAAHHNWKRRLTRRELPTEVWEYAEEYGFVYWLERHHPE